MPRAAKAVPAATDVRISPVKDTPRVFTDKMEVTQGKLSLGFRLGEIMLAPNYPALMVFNAVYGGAVTSKLFENVREKLSLCYYASSRVEKHKGVMAVTSGVEFSKFEEAKNEILHQLDLMKQGEISDFELVAARRAVITSIKATLDSPLGLEELCFDYRLAEISITPDEMAALCDSVTREELVRIANSTRLDAVYYLTGKEAE
jgi:predicted Zn-dependent peptidase